MKVGRATSMGVDSGVEVLGGPGPVPGPGGVAHMPGLETLHSKGASKVRFSVPSMEFVWETDPDGSKKVTFLVGCDGEPVVVVLGAGAGANNVEDVDHILQEQARHQADQEADMIKKAAEEELDKLVRLSRSTVAAMEQEATKTHTSKVRDATREAVVQSLQEATMEMERNIRALEEVAPSTDLPLQEATNTGFTAVNGSKHTNGEINRINGSSSNGSLQIVNGTTNGTMGIVNGLMSNTTESSTDTNRQSHIFSSKCSESTASTASLSSLSTLSDPSTPSPSTSPPSPPAFTITSYGGRYSPPHKLQTATIWNEKVSSTNTISNNKPPITTPKPVITKTTTTVSSTTTLKTLNGTIVANKNANNITTTNEHNITHSVTNNQSSLSKTYNTNSNKFSTIPSNINSSNNSLSSNGSTSSNSITPPSSLSSTVSMASLPPSPPPSAPSSPTVVLEDCLKEEMEAMEKLESIRAAAEASEIQRMGVAAQIRRWEQFSEGSLEALKTATLERAKKRRQREILENLRHQVEVARRGQGHHDDAKLIPEKDDQAWQEQERKAKEAERRIREIARRAREEHRRAVHTSPNGVGIPHAHAINRNLNGLTHNNLFNNGINATGSLPSTNGGDINGNIKTIFDDVSNNNSESSSSKNGRTCVRQRIRPPKPPSRAAIVTWFREEEIARGSGLDPSKSHVAPWFHGIISRVEAEEVLSGSAVGSFLVRVSERIWGYAISYRGVDRCRHYLIDVTNGKYTFFGSHNASHDTLSDLVEHHCTEPITSTGGELLTHPRAQVNPCRPDYLELFTGTHYLSL